MSTETLAQHGEGWIGLAMIGKTAFALLLIVAIILLCAWLLRRLNGLPGQGQTLKVVGSRALGPKERLVVVEVEGTWLVLGVGGGGINKVHEMPAPTRAASADESIDAGEEGTSFAARFAKALSANGKKTLGGNGKSGGIGS
ncbi:flagellar biosynthetic protein FliO [Alloalcanivorax xenomutans]|uniref:flagellar biosynthetic protein FliO n=1 Tax=Alloalcanivorax xenomutans TaxID=1094342 RepID=UPI0029353249|nr:flagellar biosynthetic protein FliO [Alloalcanivorax xenomutans]WOD27360.1 flagellar biosynthetic protein FliO [Alloalcanivorax xenomutans]